MTAGAVALPMLAVAVAGGCASPEAWALDGCPLHRPPLSDDVRAARERDLAAAQAALAAHPDDADAAIWVGRRLGYLGRFRDAIAAFGDGLARHPDDPRFLRHRGHRWITVRRLDAAIADLGRAARMIEGRDDEVEPDGMPNERGIPTSTLHFNVWYHLGLAYYLRGDLPQAAAAYERCHDASRNPDALCATTYWRYLTLRRLQRDAEAQRLLAPITADLDVIENHAYHRLLLAYRGELDPEQLLAEAGGGVEAATIGYGVAAWHLLGGRAVQAYIVCRQVRAETPWPSFGHLAAEALLAE